MGFSTVVGAIAFMLIFVSMMVFAVSVQRNFSQQATAQTQFTAQQRTAMQSAITISNPNYAYAPVELWTDELYWDFAVGTMSNTLVQSPGSVVLVGPVYTSNGTFVSQIIDTGFTDSNYTALSWTSVNPGGTQVYFQTRAAGSVAALQAAPFIGPNGSADNYFGISGTQVNETQNLSRYFQYKAYLNTSDTGNTPILQSVSIGVVRPVGVTTFTLTNTGSVPIQQNLTDIYLGGRHVARNVTSRILSLQYLAGGQALWYPGEDLDVTVFQTLSGSALVSVSNGATNAATTVN